jgi:hypothetical protein
MAVCIADPGEPDPRLSELLVGNVEARWSAPRKLVQVL